MNHRHFESQLADDYDRGANRYRQDDEIEVQSENHLRLGNNLRRICGSFPHSIRALEIGCGTGRYFHWLENAELLVATDLSAQMLQHARRPVHAERVKVGEIRLLQGNIYDMSFEPRSFDLIYSLGMFGYGAEMTIELGRKLHAWLTPGGRLYFNAIEVPSSSGMRLVDRFKRHMRHSVLPRLPSSLRRRLKRRSSSGVPLIRHRRESVHNTMRAAGFAELHVSSVPCVSPLWNGVHVECLARKQSIANMTPDVEPHVPVDSHL